MSNSSVSNLDIDIGILHNNLQILVLHFWYIFFMQQIASLSSLFLVDIYYSLGSTFVCESYVESKEVFMEMFKYLII